MICSFMDSSGYASGPIKRCLFIGYIINLFTKCVMKSYDLPNWLIQFCYQSVSSPATEMLHDLTMCETVSKMFLM